MSPAKKTTKKAVTKKAAPKADTKAATVPKTKPKVMFIAFGGCNGCHVSTTDLYEEVAELFGAIDLVRGSVLVDMNRDDIPEVDIAVIEGAVCNVENLEAVKKIGERAKTVVALGSCSSFGGIPGLRNYFDVNECIVEAYNNLPSNSDKDLPNDYDSIPKQLDKVLPISGVIDVDYVIPGCPPVPSIIKSALLSLANGKDPVLPTKNLCEECGRKSSKIEPGDRKFITMKIDAVIESDLEPDVCFLEQGVMCMGPATRSGCGGRCTKSNMPCRGCMGPNPHAVEQGAEMSNAMAPMLPIGALVNKEDLAGTFYRYSLPASILPTILKDSKDIKAGELSNKKTKKDTEKLESTDSPSGEVE